MNALGQGLKDGCQGENLVTVHPVSGRSTSKFFADSPWIDFHMIQGKSGSVAESVLYDAAAMVENDYMLDRFKPTMMAEHRYESGSKEDPLIQRRSLYQCVFAGGFGYAYGHNALWQMTPHTAQPWMLKGWSPGVDDWKEALDTAAVRQFKHIQTLLESHPDPDRFPDQGLVLAGQGGEVATRIRATRDGTRGKNDATYLMAYLSAPSDVTLDTGCIASRGLKVSWFDPETGTREEIQEELENTGKLFLKQRTRGIDAVAVVEAVEKNDRSPR